MAVHPHMRGEHSWTRYGSVPMRCSSPHAWGTRAGFLQRLIVPRFIPTCVGNTPFSARAVRVRKVHPHMRGEHMVTREPESKMPGSSPHAWGTLYLERQSRQYGRFIPTCVGNTSS